jgi:hypothetical protein
VEGEWLIYAEAGRPEYKNYEMTDILIINMAGSAQVDPIQGQAALA